MICEAEHDWKDTGVRRPHTGQAMMRYGVRDVDYVRCSRCNQIGFRRGLKPVVYAWREED